ncbi:MAG: hypothetical protein GXP49_13615 [Deltaproteobacteria bacterium]|nr:hypothetical protein [Deltaproteobacteria bacterium]
MEAAKTRTIVAGRCFSAVSRRIVLLAGLLVLAGCGSGTKSRDSDRCVLDSDCPGRLICGQKGDSFGKCVECDSDSQCPTGQVCSERFKCIDKNIESSESSEFAHDADLLDQDSRERDVDETDPGFSDSRESLSEMDAWDNGDARDLNKDNMDESLLENEKENCIPACAGKCPGADNGCDGTCKQNLCTGCCNGVECITGTDMNLNHCGPPGSSCLDCSVAYGNRSDRCLDGICSCGNTKTICDTDWSCKQGECKPGCTPDCTGKCAGADDGCGGNCPSDDCPDTCCEAKCCGAGQACYAGACCTPQSCFELGFACGRRTNGCGGTQDCGTCPVNSNCTNLGQCECNYEECNKACCNQGEVCFNGSCCKPKTCADLGKQCGTFDDGCGGQAQCGGCGTAPADTCTDGNTLRHFVSPLRCVNGSCQMDYVDLNCVFGCAGGNCNTCDYECGGIMKVWTRWNITAWNDRMISGMQTEQCDNCIQEGQAFYVPATSGNGKGEVYRLYSGASTDHMMSTIQGESGYQTEYTAGYPYSSLHAGLYEVRRWVNKSTGDHAVGLLLDNLDTLGYEQESVLGYAYPRGGNYWSIPVAFSGSLVKMEVNEVAGGAVSGLTWNNKQFVNDFDYGREIQVAFNLSNTGEQDNPTEAGDKYGAPGVKDAPYAHGSAILYANSSGKEMETICLPLQWRPELHGGNQDQPVMWDGIIGKKIDLDFNGWPDVLRWTTKVVFPRNQSFLNMELVTAYLNGDFNRFFTYDAVSGKKTEKTAAVPSGGCVDPSADPDQRPEAGGVLISTADQNYALGVYHNGPEVSYGLCNFLGQGGGNGPTDASTSKWNALYRPPGGVKAGTFVKTLYLVVGTVDGVIAGMKNLHDAGY